MKLYVWANPYSIEYGTSVVFAVADNEEAAREQAKHGRYYAFAEYDHRSEETMEALATIELKEPTRVVDLPCAEWWSWSE